MGGGEGSEVSEGDCRVSVCGRGWGGRGGLGVGDRGDYTMITMSDCTC